MFVLTTNLRVPTDQVWSGLSKKIKLTTYDAKSHGILYLKRSQNLFPCTKMCLEKVFGQVNNLLFTCKNAFLVGLAMC